MKKQIKSKEKFQFGTNNFPRLSLLKEDRFLTHRILVRISENMHYEIFKYLNFQDLLEIRGLGLGGFQLTNNNILNSRIGRSIVELHPSLSLNPYDIKDNQNIFEFIFELTENQRLALNFSIYIYIYIAYSNMHWLLILDNFGGSVVTALVDNIQLLSNLYKLDLGKYSYIYIYIYRIQ